MTGLRGKRASAGLVWRRSLQVRVVASTLALSAAVVFVLGMILQTEVTDRLLSGKREAAVKQAHASLDTLQPTLIGVNPTSEALKSRMVSALSKLTRSGPRGQDSAGSTAGAYTPVLADAFAGASHEKTPAVGPYRGVPQDLRSFVQGGQMATKIVTVDVGGGPTTYLIVGTPVSTALRPLQLYLLFPLSAEKYTVEVVQSTLLVGGLVLLLLLAGIANLVTRQVVRPVRRAAEVAERFAGGHLEERMKVVGEDDVARLAESYNEMAESIAEQIRQLEEFGQLQRRFTSDVSHELRTPLTTVRMAADVLHASREQFPVGLSRSTELLVDELDRFEALLADLLEISRLDAGVEELSRERVDMVALAQGSIESVRGISGATNTEIVLESPRDEVYAEVDTRRVERILRNLLANAIDHGEGLPVKLIVGADSDAIAVAIRDRGIGLRPGEAELVFNRFWRADPSRNRRTGGTGLGLAISLEDARLHGGWLQAWGEPGNGACFMLTLPRRPDVTLTASPLPMPPDAPRPPELPPATDATRSDDTDTDTDSDHGAVDGAGEGPDEPGTADALLGGPAAGRVADSGDDGEHDDGGRR